MKEIRDCKGYYVSKEGRVYSEWSRGRRGGHTIKIDSYPVSELKQHKVHNGYYQCSLIKSNGERTFRKVHRIVAEAYITNPDNKPQVNHKDLDKSNNSVSNLEWNTQTENMRHARENGVFSKPRPDRRKLTVIDGVEYESRTEASEKLGVPISSISRMVKYGKNWREIENTRIRESRRLKKLRRNYEPKIF